MALFILQPDGNGTCCDCNSRAEPCDSCGETTCQCALVTPRQVNFGDRYSSLADAQNVISSFVSNCIGFIAYFTTFPPAFFSFTATTPSNNLKLQASVSWSGTYTETPMWSSLSLKSGSVLTINWSHTWSIAIGTSSSYQLYDCDMNLLFTQAQNTSSTGPGSDGGTFTTPAIPSDGTYIISCRFNNGVRPPVNESGTFTISSNNTMVVNPVIAIYDDSGIARQLEACPKLEIPPLQSGSWYANQSAAQSAINTLTSNCVGFEEFPGELIGTFIATNGGSSLKLAWTGPSIAIASLIGSVNLQTGKTISVIFNMTIDLPAFAAAFTCFIYDDQGTLLQSISDQIIGPSGTKTITSSLLPYTGQYIIKIYSQPGVGITAFSGNITSNGTLSINPVQALYDVGLDCPARLNCS